jgi:hypothetical protein
LLREHPAGRFSTTRVDVHRIERPKRSLGGKKKILETIGEVDCRCDADSAARSITVAGSRSRPADDSSRAAAPARSNEQHTES